MSASQGRYGNYFTELIIALACTNLITLIAVFPRNSVTNAPCSSNSCFVLSLTWIMCAEKKERSQDYYLDSCFSSFLFKT